MVKWTIQMLVKGSEDGWVDFDDADSPDKAVLRFRWIKHYYKDDTFRLINDCEHKDTEWIPKEEDTNTQEDVWCLDCEQSVIDQIEEGEY